MPAEKLNLILVALQTLAALIAGSAALAMWKSTVNLVEVTRDTLLADVAPEVVIGLEHSQPFATKDRANVKNENRGSVNLVEVQIEAGCRFTSDDRHGRKSVMEKYAVGDLKSGKSHKFSLWDLSKNAIREKQRLDAELYSRARASGNAPVEVEVKCRHGATGIPHLFTHIFLVQFDPEGNLLVSELFVSADGERTLTVSGNITTEETIKTIPLEELANSDEGIS